MTRAAKLIPALLVPATLSLALACGGEAPAPTKVEVSQDPAEVSEPQASEPQAVAKVGVPKITSDAAVHEFGAIKATDSIEHVFTIRNAGTADLKIERVQRT